MASVLFVGGTGQISLSCVEVAVKAGHEVTVFNRGKVDARLPSGVATLTGDVKDPASYAQLKGQRFDVVCQFLAFTPDQLAQDLAVFTGTVGQYIFISSASVYEKPASHYVITEQTPAVNPYWLYSQNKIACENLLTGQTALPWTIIRPSHTVRTGLPTMVGEGDVIARRMLAGKPVIVAGDGKTPWTLTRSQDFAVPFVNLFGKPAALGEVFHITSNRAYTWDAIYTAIADGIGGTADIVHVPTDTMIRYNRNWEGPLTGDKSWAALFDNSKVKAVAGDFQCVEVLSEVLAEPIMHLKQRLAGPAADATELETLIDRMAKEQSALGL
ncbi:MAG: putative mRNA-binding protein [Devosia sp.]|nr:putative mRNA-binding protein [Devosia sp.]